MPRVVAIGLDAAEWRLIEQLLDRGELPNLKRIRQRSAECRLRNQAMYRSTLVWEAFLTGKENPNDPRGGGVGFDPSTYKAYKIGAGTHPPFYTRFPACKTIAFDVPHLSLADESRDVRICTWGTHSWSHPRASRPAGLLREIDATFGPHPAFGKEHAYGWHRPQFVDWLVRALTDGSRRRVEIALWLQKRFPDWAFFLTVMSEAHSAGESFGYVLEDNHPLATLPCAAVHRDRLCEAYRALDEAIGRFESGLPEDAVLVVFSLHGTTSNAGELASTVLLPELLHRLSFGRPLLRDPNQEAWQRAGYPVVVLGPGQSWDSYMRDHFADVFANRLKWTVRRLLPEVVVDRGRMLQHRLIGSRSPRRIKHAASVASETNFTPEQIGEFRSSLEWQVPCWYRRFWPRMTVFALPTFGDARLRVNLRGRERDGIVEASDYERTCSKVEEWIRACRDPRTGRPVVPEISRTRAQDPMDPEGSDADLVISWSHALDALEHPEAGIVGPFPFHRTGAHTSRGFVFFSGAGIERVDLGERDAIDLPPTILALLGHEPCADLDGGVILRIPSELP